MKKELLSPVGNTACLSAAINNGADAIYLGGKSFGARKFAGNFTDDELKEAVTYSHLYGVKVYVTVNTIIYNDEVESFIEYIDYLYKIGVDALIMQDIGMINLVHNRYPDFEINASTQMHNHNNYDLALLKEQGITKVVIDRELSLKEVENLDQEIAKEVFIHGALCNSYSGCCLFSSMNGGRSGNRGECVQSCRLPYRLLQNNKYLTDNYQYLLSTKELNTTSKIKELMTSDISSFKIEGRMKSPSYVGYVTQVYRRLIDDYSKNKITKLTPEEEDNLQILFNRTFTTGYLFNDKVMNIETPNHQGLDIGVVEEVTPKKIKVKLNKTLYQEDGLRFKKSNLGMVANKIYNSQGLLINKAEASSTIYLDNKINLQKEDIVVKTSSVELEREILAKEPKRIPITITFDGQLLTFKDDENHLVQTVVPSLQAINRPTTSKEAQEKLIKLGNTSFKVKEIKITLPSNIFINMKDINTARRLLVDKLIEERTKISRIPKTSHPSLEYREDKNYSYEISVLARSKEQVESALDLGVTRIYVDKPLYNEYSHYDNIYLRLSRVTSNYQDNEKNILVTELGGIYKYRHQNCNIISDYYLNVVNNYSINYLLKNNVQRVTLSPEINYDYLDDYLKDKIEIIIYGRLELMLTKSCPVHELINKCPCNQNDKYYLEDTNHHKYPLLHENCLTHIMHYKNIDYLDKLPYYKDLGIRSYRLELFDEDYKETSSLIKKVKDVLM